MMASARSSRRQVPFGGHQLAEYALAAALVVVAVHLGGRPELVLLLAGAVVGALALVSNGPLAAVRIVPRRLHLYLDLVVAAGFALSPLLYMHDLQVIPIVLSEAVAVVLVRMSLTTEIVPRQRPRRGVLSALSAPAVPAAPPAPGTLAAPSAPAADPAGGSDAVSAAAATAGRVVGTAVAKVRDSGAPLVAARSLGRAAGHARRLGRAARATRATSDAPNPVAVPPGPSKPSA
jgi:hypothetical protein